MKNGVISKEKVNLDIVEFYMDKNKEDRISKLNRSKSGARDDTLM